MDGTFGPEAVAARVVREGVAPVAAAGLAVRREGRWELSAGGATEALFDLASLTKPMTALAFARSGLDRRAPLGASLIEAKGTASEAAPLELLLAHRAGLLAHVMLSKETALRTAAASRRPDCAGAIPIEGFDALYSDLGFLLAGEALARSVGAVDAGEAIERFVVGPLALEGSLGTARALRESAGAGTGTGAVDFDARVVPTEVVPGEGEIRGVVHDENAREISGDGGSGHAGMFGTVEAVLRFGAAALDAIVRGEGPLASPAGEDLGWMIRPRPGGVMRAGFDGKSDDGASSAGALAGPRTFGHLGFTGTSLWIDPDRDALVVLLTNRVHPTRENLRIRTARPVAHDALWRLATNDAR